MGIRIELDERAFEYLLGQILLDNVGISYEGWRRFTKWALEKYVYSRSQLEQDLQEELSRNEWSLAGAILSLLPDRQQLRMDWFRHIHRDHLLTLEQAVAMFQMGKELWVCDYDSDGELDMFTTVSIDEWDESFEELTVWAMSFKGWALEN